jgi:hypothetical protein
LANNILSHQPIFFYVDHFASKTLIYSNLSSQELLLELQTIA